MSDYIEMAARLVRSAPADLGDDPPIGAELDKIGDLMRDAAVMLRSQGDAHANVLRLLADLTDADDCTYDHHGNCQAHSLHEKPCPHERAKVILRKAGRL